MRVLGINIKLIRRNELKNILKKLNSYDAEIYNNMKDGHNFLINNNFLVGYKNLINDIIIVYIARDDKKNYDGIYVRKKIKIFKRFLEKYLGNKKVVSGVRIERKEALKMNEYLFQYKTDPLKLDDGNTYVIYKNFME